MVNKIVPSFLLMAAVVGVVLGVVGLLFSDSVGADGHSSTRSFSPSQIAPGGEVSVRIAVNNYGQFGGVAETIPADFTYVVGSSNVDVEVDGRTLEFALYDEAAVTYRVRASDTADSYVFSGDLIDDQGDRRSIGGDSSFTVTARPGPTAQRSFSPSQIAPSGVVSVRIAVNNYGQFGGVAETIPADFTYVAGSSNVDVEVDGRTLEFALYDEAAVTYRVRASDTADSYVFSGDLIDDQGNRSSIGGSSRVTVRVVAPEPEVNRAPAFRRSSTTRSIVENSASGANVGLRVTASDPDRDTLTYTLTGTDASSFTINSGTGQIRVGAGITLDYENKSSYSVTVTATDPDSESASARVTVRVTNVDEDGTVMLSSMAPVVGVELTAALDDPDMVTENTVTWQWSKSMEEDGTFMDIDGATSMSYTPVVADDEYHLRAKAMYTDGHGSGKTEMATTTGMVTTVQDQEGMVALSSMTPVVGVELTATLSDPDGGVTGTTWQWSRSDTMDGTFMDIDGATMVSYTPVAADDGYYLQATAMYDDAHGSGKMRMATTASMVTAGDPLIVRYDTNENGQIDKSEVITAINDYLFGEGDEAISKADVISLINLYLFG